MTTHHYEFSTYMKPILDMYTNLQKYYDKHAEELTNFNKSQEINHEMFVNKLKEVVKFCITATQKNSELVVAIDRLSQIDVEEVKNPAGFPKFFKTTENLAIILKLIRQLESCEYLDQELSKLLDKLLMDFLWISVELTRKIYISETKKENEKLN